METFRIDKRSKQAKIFYEYLKTLPFIEISDEKKTDLAEPEKKVLSIKERNKLIKELSKTTNKNVRLKLDKKYNSQ
ncbi:MAG: hypothetical protein WCY89_08660 [Flavobacteriaceae bacterium]